jgi:ferredoxin-NADP reductase/hemoglobin-like flavoprotein
MDSPTGVPADNGAPGQNGGGLRADLRRRNGSSAAPAAAARPRETGRPPGAMTRLRLVAGGGAPQGPGAATPPGPASDPPDPLVDTRGGGERAAPAPRPAGDGTGPAAPFAPPAPFVPAGLPGPAGAPAAPAHPSLPSAPPTAFPPAPPVPGVGGRPGPGAVSADARLIRRTLAEIEPIADKVTSYFYALLFIRHPELRSLFPAAMDLQRDRLLKALLTAAEHRDDTETLTAYLRPLGRGHRKYGTEPAHYPAVGEALIGALSRYAGNTWDPETEAAWNGTYALISRIMIEAAGEDARTAPAWWQAEVVAHELRTPSIAVLTLRPDQAYPYRAGQYTSLETPWWPRVWRHYSFAAAPRPDGLLTFHVKAVPAGWVSNALVHRARPGDVLRLGAPAGSMTVDHRRDNGLLCLGGGTGIAPIRAMVEELAGYGTRRPVEVFYGARSDHDLYDIDTLRRLGESCPWLSVRPVVDGRARFIDEVSAAAPWPEYDACVSGPPGMIRRGVDALLGAGVPSARIRHDALDQMAAGG